MINIEPWIFSKRVKYDRFDSQYHLISGHLISTSSSVFGFNMLALFKWYSLHVFATNRCLRFEASFKVCRSSKTKEMTHGKRMYVLTFCVYKVQTCHFPTNHPSFKHPHPTAGLDYFFLPSPLCRHHKWMGSTHLICLLQGVDDKGVNLSLWFQGYIFLIYFSVKSSFGT